MAKKIIHLILGKANPNRANGVNKVVRQLASSQTEIGHQVEVWGITKNPVHDYPERNFDTQLFLDHCSKIVLDKKLKKRIASLSNTQVIFHLHGAYLPQFFLLAKLLVKHQIQYIYTPHGAFNLVAMQRSFFKKKIYNALFESFIVKNAKAVHSIGDSELIGTKSTFKNAKNICIPNGQMPQEQALFSKTQKLFPIFGFVGRIDMHTKGLDMLLEGFSVFLKATGSKAELWLIGAGGDIPKLMTLAQKLDIESQVKFMGAVFGIEKINLMQQFDYLCLNSRNEGLPGVVLEAAEMGIPSIVSKETNLAAYISEFNAGFVLPKNTPDYLSNRLFKASNTLQQAEYKLQAENAKTMVKQKFDWSSIAQKHIGVYES